MKCKPKVAVSILIALMFIFSVSMDIAKAEKSGNKNHSDKACPHKEVKKVKGSKIVFLEDSFDFGQIPYDRKVTHIFPFKNEGTSPLLLARHVSSKPIEGC